MSQSAAALLRLLIVVAIVAAVFLFKRELVTEIRAPVQAELNASRGNNAALKGGIDAQNKGIDGLKAASTARKATSAAAAKKAGEEDYAAAKALLSSKAPGETPLGRAANRINAEFSP